MSRYQAAIYNWVKSTGTLRLDPNNALAGKTRHPFVPLNNKVMELRKVREIGRELALGSNGPQSGPLCLTTMLGITHMLRAVGPACFHSLPALHWWQHHVLQLSGTVR